MEDRGDSAGAVDRKTLGELAIANRILSAHRGVYAFGHVSIRDDQVPGGFLLARNMSPAQVTTDDVIELPLDGSPVNAGGHAVYLERFIHGAIYRACKDVRAAVHSHTPAACPADANVVLLRGHGATIVGTTLPEAVFRHVSTQRNTGLEYHVLQLGAVTCLSEGETCATTLSLGSQIDRAWALWQSPVSMDMIQAKIMWCHSPGRKNRIVGR